MKNTVCVIIMTIILFTSCEEIKQAQEKAKESRTEEKTDLKFDKIEVDYSIVKRDTTIKNNYHGKVLGDPYRWLEDENSGATKDWVKAQNKTTFSYLDAIPFRDGIEERLQTIWNYERFSTPFKKGGKYYFFRNDGLQNQSVLYAQDDLDSEEKVVLDPNKFSSDGTASLGAYSFSKDGNYLAYQVSEGGSDWRTIYIKDLKNNATLNDKVEWVKFSGISWQGDGFYYSRYPAPEKGDELSAKSEFQQVYYHKLGTKQSEDQLFFADRSNPKRGFGAQTTEDERFLVISPWESTSGNALYFKDTQSKELEFVPIIDNFENDFVMVDNMDDKLLVLTNHKAPNNRLVLINTKKPEEGYWEELIPENKTDVLRSVDLIGGKIVATYIHDASSKISIFDMQGNHTSDLDLAGIGTVGGFSGSKDDPEAFYSFASFIRPSSVYSLDMASMESKLFKAPKIAFNADDYETKQVWYESYDGKKIPMFITHKKGLKLDGKRPTLLYGYGGFDISILPQFNLTRLNLGPIFMENDGIFAVANIRGGGEFGKKWHEAGTKENKQNVFNDFQAAAEFLIGKNYTSSEKLAIYGRSNGGLLVGACMTQRPDLYKVALPAVGVLDMLRYQEFTIGRAWAGDYGLSENPKDFDYLISYSPLHNITPAKYPATMVTTADHDDRVVPAHSFKFISELQANHKGDSPALIRIETNAGHGAGKSTSKRIEEAADILSFTFYNLEENVIYNHEN